MLLLLVRTQATDVERRMRSHLGRQLQRVRAAADLHDPEETNVPRQQLVAAHVAHCMLINMSVMDLMMTMMSVIYITLPMASSHWAMMIT